MYKYNKEGDWQDIKDLIAELEKQDFVSIHKQKMYPDAKQFYIAFSGSFGISRIFLSQDLELLNHYFNLLENSSELGEYEDIISDMEDDENLKNYACIFEGI